MKQSIDVLHFVHPQQNSTFATVPQIHFGNSLGQLAFLKIDSLNFEQLMDITIGDPSEDGNTFSFDKNYHIFFIDQLNRIYAAKRRMAEILDELLEQNLFMDLAVAVRATENLVQGQIGRLDEICTILAISPIFTGRNELLALIEEGYLLIGRQQKETPTYDLSLLSFLQTVESLEIASFKVLQLAAAELGNSFVSEMLEQCTRGAETDYKLLLNLMAGHLKN